MANCCFMSGAWLSVPLIVIVLRLAREPNTKKCVTTCHALRHNLNIQKICDIFCSHTADDPTQTNCSEFYQICLFHFGTFEGVRRVLGTPFPVESAGEKCEWFAPHGRRHVYLLFISYRVYRNSSAFVKIKNQN